MINIFNIPKYKIDTGQFNNLINGSVVTQFEEEFASYIGAKYSVALNSATSAIFLLFLNKGVNVTIPSIIPPVVANALITSGNTISFKDDIDWVGNSYVLHDFGDYRVIDSAQKVERNQYNKEKKRERDILIHSFYPTKPISSCDGGMIVSNDKEIIDEIRCLAYNGMSNEANNWERKISKVGYKFYMNSLQAYMAKQNLEYLEGKNNYLATIRDIYNTHFTLSNTSLHLYRILVNDNEKFIKKAKENGIVCGIHYKALHKNSIYSKELLSLRYSEFEEKHTVSIPFHEKLNLPEIKKVIQFVDENRDI